MAKLSDKEKVRVLKNLQRIGCKYNPGRGSITIVDPVKFAEAFTGMKFNDSSNSGPNSGQAQVRV